MHNIFNRRDTEVVICIIFRGEYRIPGARPLKLEKNRIFWRKIVIFHTKYLNNFRASLRSAQCFKSTPLTLNPGSAPNISSFMESRWLQLLPKYQIAYKAIVRHRYVFPRFGVVQENIVMYF